MTTMTETLTSLSPDPMPIAVSIAIVANGGRRGELYQVTHYGNVIVDRSHQPILEAARYFESLGVRGRLAVYRDGSSVPCAVADIETAANTVVIESATAGPRFGRYRPFLPIAASAAEASQ